VNQEVSLLVLFLARIPKVDLSCGPILYHTFQWLDAHFLAPDTVSILHDRRSAGVQSVFQLKFCLSMFWHMFKIN
jgi:hypothetical protein